MPIITKEPREKLRAIQQLRGVAVLSVMLLHAINVVDFRVIHGVQIDAGYLRTLLSINEFGAFGVDLFFVISGFIMAMLLETGRITNSAQFIYRRFVRIVPMFWISCAFYAFITILFGRRIEIGQVISGITIIPSSLYHYDLPVLVVGWSLAFELSFYALVALVLPFRARLELLAILIMGLVSWALVMRPPPGLFAVAANPIQLEFLWGIGVYALTRKLRLRATAPLLGLALLGTGLGLLMLQIVTGPPFGVDASFILAGITSSRRALVWGVPSAMLVAGAVLWTTNGSKTETTFGRFLRLTGDASYSLYLSHLAVCLITEELMPEGAMSGDAIIAIILTVSWIFGKAVYVYVEQPMLNVLHRFLIINPVVGSTSPRHTGA